MIMRRLLFSTGNVFLSLVLGAIAFGYVLFNHPDQMQQIIGWASSLKNWLTTRGISPAYNNWIHLLLEERQLTYMGFTIVARIVLSIVTGTLTWMWDTARS